MSIRRRKSKSTRRKSSRRRNPRRRVSRRKRAVRIYRAVEGGSTSGGVHQRWFIGRWSIEGPSGGGSTSEGVPTPVTTRVGKRPRKSSREELVDKGILDTGGHILEEDFSKVLQQLTQNTLTRLLDNDEENELHLHPCMDCYTRFC